MGFSNYAKSVIRSNRMLVKNVTNRYFKKKHNKTLIAPKIIVGLNPEILQKSKKKRVVKTLKCVLPILVLTSILTAVAYKTLHTELSNSIQEKREYLDEINSTSMEEMKNEEFHNLVQYGEHYLSTESLDHAYDKFIMALKLYPNSKKANIGLTKTMLMKCNLNQTYCSEAQNYFSKLVALKVLTHSEAEELERLK